MRIPSRRTFWLSAALLLAVFGVWLFTPQRRVTYANFWQIKREMSQEEVKAILGHQFQVLEQIRYKIFEIELDRILLQWSDGPNRITIEFENDKTTQRYIHVADTWETLKWHAKRIGITW
jgi:hypothetical protein